MVKEEEHSADPINRDSMEKEKKLPIFHARSCTEIGLPCHTTAGIEKG
jgi:hypothetical protein